MRYDEGHNLLHLGAEVWERHTTLHPGLKLESHNPAHPFLGLKYGRGNLSRIFKDGIHKC